MFKKTLTYFRIIMSASACLYLLKNHALNGKKKINAVNNVKVQAAFLISSAAYFLI